MNPSSLFGMSYCALLLQLLLLCDYASAQGGGIPGSTHTLSGYDTEMGVDPICWSSVSADKNNGERFDFANPLVANFTVGGNVTLQPACPTGNSLTAYAPVNRETILGANVFNRSRLRTGTWYDFPVRATFNLTSIDRKYFVSDFGPTVAFQVILCINGVAGFCAPFIHEQANARIVRNGGTIGSIKRGNQHGGTHVHSAYVFRNLTAEDGPIYDIELEIPMLVNDPADFYAIAAVQFFLGDAPDDVSVRMDMANALVKGQRLLVYVPPAEILEVPKGVLVFCNIIRALSAAVIAFLLGQTIYHRNHQVLKLSQQPFLVVFLMAALVATVGSVLLEPKNDFYCRWSKFVVVSSLHIMLAVTAGRMWRINAVISPLLAQTLRRKEAKCNRFFRRLLFNKQDRKATTIRTEFQPWHLTAAIAIFSVPTVLVLLAAAIWQEETLTMEYNFEKSTGRQTCSDGLPFRQRLSFYGFGLLVCLVLLLLCMAHATRHLPSLFNETEVIFSTGLTCLIVLGLGFAVIQVTDDPETSPGVEYLTWSLQLFFITVNTSYRIMLPKLQMVWRGETVLVSKLVADHARTVREDDENFLSTRSGSGPGFYVTGLESQSETSSLNHPHGKGRVRRESNSQDVADSLNNFERETLHSTGDHPLSELVSNKTDDSEGQVSSSLDQDEAGPLQSQKHRPSTARRVAFKVDPGLSGNSERNGNPDGVRRSKALNSQKSVIQPMTISQSESPSRRLVLKMYHLQEQLTEVNQRIMSGAAVSKADWEKLRRLSTRMGDTFHAVSFDWAPEENAETYRLDDPPSEEERDLQV